jgi:hypothetical protein
MNEYRPLNRFYKQTDELKKLIEEHPDYPIIVLVDSEVVADDYCSYWYAPSLSFSVGEILDCDQDINDERTFTDRDDFREEVSYRVFECDDEFDTKYSNMPDEEFEKLVDEFVAKYDEYWKPVIIINAYV